MGDAGVPLADLLRLAEWGPRQLVAAINSRLSGQGRERLRLDPTAGYSWVRRGFRPRPPIPDVAAAVLTERLGYTVTVAQLWPGSQEAGGLARSATDELDHLTGIDGLIRELSQLSTTAATPQSPIAEATGVELDRRCAGPVARCRGRRPQPRWPRPRAARAGRSDLLTRRRVAPAG